jgi:hypothetical protein
MVNTNIVYRRVRKVRKKLKNFDPPPRIGGVDVDVAFDVAFDVGVDVAFDVTSPPAKREGLGVGYNITGRCGAEPRTRG